MRKTMWSANKSFLRKFQRTGLALPTFAAYALAMHRADAQIQTDAQLWSVEKSSQVGTASQFVPSDFATPAMLAIAMIGLAIYIYRFRKQR